MNFPGKLPTSQEEVKSLLLVMLLALGASLARLLSGTNVLYWRYVVGSTLMSCFVAILTYAALVNYLDGGTQSGYFAVAVGVLCGLFTDDIISSLSRRLKAALKKGEK